MRISLLLLLTVCAAQTLAQPQSHDHSNHRPAPQPEQDPHAGHRMPGADNPDQPPETPPPAAASTGPAHAADLYFDPARMAEVRAQIRSENGAMRTGMAMLDQFETTFSDEAEGYAWNAQGWFGGDLHRLWFKSEGEGEFGDALEDAELQLLYGRAISPYFDLQAGIRQQHTPDEDWTDLTLGIQGLAPYWFEVNAAAFLSSEGDLRARAESEYDLRLTQRLILQLHGELNLAAEDIPELALSSGITSIEVGVRLRYEFSRRFAPYVGVQWTDTSGFSDGSLGITRDDSNATQVLIGLRAWY